MAFVFFAVLHLLAPQVVLAQTPAGRPEFEVASVKVNTSGDRRSFMRLDVPDSVTFTNQRLDTLIQFAYRIAGYKLSGGPGWITTERFDIVAKAERRGSFDEKMDMLRTLLEDRFKVKLRTEAKDGDIYSLVPARSDRRLGPDLKPSAPECDALIAARSRGELPAPPAPKPGERPECGRATGGPSHFLATGVEMSWFATTLGGMMMQTVVDRTALTGRFDLELKASLEGARYGLSGPPPSADRPPSIFTALQEQLGLKLEHERGPIETYVIESAERPTPD
jgi:uncharacterized protein (TIGR03435 family)